MAVVRGNDVLVLKGYGRRQHRLRQVSVTPDTIFPLASCTKQFTTTLLAMLVDGGVIDWDDRVKKLYPRVQTFRPERQRGCSRSVTSSSPNRAEQSRPPLVSRARGASTTF